MLDTLPAFLKRRIVFREAAQADSSSYKYQRRTLKQQPSPAPPSAELFSRQRAHELNAWKSVVAIGPGLANLGNTCFLNSVLQCITYTPALARYLLEDDRKHSHADGQREFCALCAMAEHAKACVKSSSASVLRPISFVTHLRAIARHMRPGRQEDAHEFLRYLLDVMRQDCLRGMHALTPQQKETTAINRIFGGRLVSSVTCMSCKHVSRCYDAFMDLSLDVKHADTVERALLAFTTPETLSRTNKYKCEGCDRLVEAQKQFLIDTAPEVLTIQLKRFDPNAAYTGAGKIMKHVAFGTQLSLASFTATQNDALYELYGVLVHEGHTCNSGHYHCFVKASNGMWYSMNDSSVSSVGLPAVLQQKAYILFYRQAEAAAANAVSNETLISPPPSKSTSPLPHKGRGDEKLGRGDEKLGRGDEKLGRGEEKLGCGEEKLGCGEERLGHGDERLGHGDVLVQHSNRMLAQHGLPRSTSMWHIERCGGMKRRPSASSSSVAGWAVEKRRK